MTIKSDYELYEEMYALQNQLTQAISQLKVDGVRYAESERDYKITLKQKALELRANDTPITLIDKIVYGFDEVANKRFERDKAESLYKATQETINTIKLSIRILDNQIAREYGQVK